jgi:hypothetical protein
MSRSARILQVDLLLVLFAFLLLFVSACFLLVLLFINACCRSTYDKRADCIARKDWANFPIEPLVKFTMGRPAKDKEPRAIHVFCRDEEPYSSVSGKRSTSDIGASGSASNRSRRVSFPVCVIMFRRSISIF